MASSHTKILSIIVPSYNMEAYLPKCLGSLVIEDKELLQKLDVIVVNDGSKDQTSEIAHEFERMFPGVFRVIDKANGHYGSCINAGLKIATGEFVKILDADDTYDTPVFENMLRVLDSGVSDGRFESLDCFVTCYCEVDERWATKKICSLDYLAKEKIISYKDIPADTAFQMHAIAYRRQVLLDIGYVQSEGIMYTDTEWMIYPMEGVRSIYYWPQPVYRYLVARAGQSMAPEVQWKCVDHRIRMYARMVRESMLGKWSEKSRIRMRNMSLRGLKVLYFKAVVVGGLLECDARFARIDDSIKACDIGVYQYVEDIRLFNRLKYLYFVKRWRKNRRLPFIYKVAILAYYYISVLKHR